MIPDLHTHTTASDGHLAPMELVERAAAAGVSLLSITDHDTTAAYATLPPAASLPLTLLPGIELSAVWGSVGVHVVGLGIDPADTDLGTRTRLQGQRRIERARRIAHRLEQRGVPVDLDRILEAAGDRQVGRPDFAAALVRHGHVRSEAAAFRKHLGNGKPGDVRALWPAMAEVIGWIRDAGGVAVLAHPAHYGLTWTRLRALVGAFAAAGGGAIEVVTGCQAPALTARLAGIALDAGLAGSCGSDFHAPGRGPGDVGRYAAWPERVPPVWESLP